MKVDDMLIGKQISEHLYCFDQEIGPEDLLKVIRFLAEKGRSLGSSYERNQFFYTDCDSITKQEFEVVYQQHNKGLDSWLDNFSREELVNRLGSVIKIISSTTKTEIIQKIHKDTEILFKFFKKGFIEKFCLKWHEFKKRKIFLPAVSDNAKNLAFALGSKHNTLSCKDYLQYWCLGNEYCDVEIDKDLKTEIIGDSLAINLKDSNANIIKNIEAFTKASDKSSEFDLSCKGKEIKNNDLEISEIEPIGYSLGIIALSEYFGLRKISEFKTFYEGLKRKEDTETVSKHLGKKFLIAQESHDIYCGVSHSKEIFEKISLHLKIEYLKEKRMLCKVVEQETQETVTALWEIMHDGKYVRQFVFIEL